MSNRSRNSKGSGRNSKHSKNSRKRVKETTLNHSKMVRKIEQKLKNMFIDFNTGVIIQMKLTDKLALKEKIEKVWNYRES